MSSSKNLVMHNPILLTISVISMISALFFFYLGYKSQKPMKTALKLIILISACDFITCMANLSSLMEPNESAQSECQISGFIKYFVGWAELFFYSLISLLSYLTLKEFGRFSISKMFRVAIISCIALTSLLSLIPVLHIADFWYIRVDGVCKIMLVKESITGLDQALFILLRICAYLFVVITTLIGYVQAFLLSRKLTQEVKLAYSINSKRLLLYPTAQLIISTPIIVNNLVATWTGYNYTAVLITTAFWNLSGFVNLLIYGSLLIQQKRSSPVQTVNALSEYDNTNDSLISNEISFRPVPRRTTKEEELNIFNRRESEIYGFVSYE